MRSKVDIALAREGRLNIQGWAFGKDPETPVSYEVTDGRGRSIPETSVETVRRDSVIEAFFPDYEKTEGHPLRRELGYDINVPYQFGIGEERVLIMKVDGKTRKYRFNDQILERFNSHARKKREKLLALCNWETVEVGLEYLREHGLRALWKKATHKIKGIEEDYDYNEWYKQTCITEEELQKQRATTLPVMPKFSIVIPAYKTPEKFLRRMLQSIADQTYPNFEVNVADATEYDGLVWGRQDGKRPKEVLAEFAKKDSRFRYQLLEKNLGISDNTNAAIRMASADSDFIVLCDHDDELASDALFECARTVNEHPDVQIIYTDEDKIDFESAYMFEPHFKTDYNPDLLRSVNYICHLFLMRRTLLESIAETDESGARIYERKAYDGAQDYDLILRACEAAEKLDPLQQYLNKAERESAHTARQGNVFGADRTAAADRTENPLQQAMEALKNPAFRVEKGISDTEYQLLLEGRFTSSTIRHIPKALYHWRSHQLSTAANPEAKLYAFEAGARAVYDHCVRQGLPVEKVEKGITYGFYHVHYRLEADGVMTAAAAASEKTAAKTEAADNQPLISVIIPNKDHAKDLDLAIRSFIKKGSYRNLEFIVVENNSDQQETWDYYDAIQKEFPAAEAPETGAAADMSAADAGTFGTAVNQAAPSVRVVHWKREFNYSAINNFGVQFARGEYLLFLNNDIELLEPDTLKEMLSYVQRSDVGICGARLLYPDSVIQHAGVVMGFGGIAGAAFIGIHDNENTYMHRAKCVQDYSAVTAACLLTKRSVFEAVDGFEESLAVAFNDVDYCMKVRALGLQVVYNPYALCHHYESKSRGLEDTPEKVARFNGEVVKLAKRWHDILRHGDPFYNPALTLRKSNFVLRDLNKEQPGEPFPMDILKDIV